MFATAVRYFARQAKSPAKYENQHWYRSSDSQGSCSKIFAVLASHGPLKVSECWAHAKDAGIKSKRHMKLLLRFMKQQHRVRVICNHLTENKMDRHNREFLYAAVLPKSDLKAEEGVAE